MASLQCAYKLNYGLICHLCVRVSVFTCCRMTMVPVCVLMTGHQQSPVDTEENNNYNIKYCVFLQKGKSYIKLHTATICICIHILDLIYTYTYIYIWRPERVTCDCFLKGPHVCVWDQNTTQPRAEPLSTPELHSFQMLTYIYSNVIVMNKAELCMTLHSTGMDIDI